MSMVCFACRRLITGTTQSFQVAHGRFHVECYPVPREALEKAIERENGRTLRAVLQELLDAEPVREAYHGFMTGCECPFCAATLELRRMP